ncbi:RHS repeat domain-containing protein [Sphingomonas sp. NCPPB 2930]
MGDNRLRVWQDLRYEYDVHGNVTRRLKGAHTDAAFEWDAEHRLSSATVTRHGVIQQTSYRYDALGRRTHKEDAFGTTHYLWDGDLMVQSSRQQKEALFIYEPGSFVPLATVQDGRTYWYQCDQIGAPLELTDAEGHIAWAADYKVWGEARVREIEGKATGTHGADTVRRPTGHGPGWSQARQSAQDALALQRQQRQPVEQPFRFQGQQFDEETGLHYNRYRYYDPEGGFYVSQDPIKLLGGVNVYKYCTNPVGFVDPWGLEPVAFKTVGNVLCIKNKFPGGSAASNELEEFGRRWNNQISSNGGSMTRRTLSDQEKKDSDKWKRNARCFCPPGTVAGHVPDAAAGGPAIPKDWMAQMPATNSYVGGIISKLPVGFTYNQVKIVPDLGGC